MTGAGVQSSEARGPVAQVLRLIRQPLFLNAIYLTVNVGFTALGGFLFWATATHLYSAEAVGIGSATIAAMSLLGTLAHLGLGSSLVRFLPREGPGRTALPNLVLTVAACTGGIAAIVFCAGLRVWSPGLGYLQAHPVYLLGFVLFAMGATVAPALNLIFVAFRNTRPVLWIGTSTQVFRVALGLLLVPLGGFGIVGAAGIATIAGVVVGIWLIGRIEPGYKPRPTISRSGLALLLGFGLANQSADVALSLPALVLPLLVVNILGAAPAAHFYIGFFMGALLLTGAQALAMSLFAEGSRDEASLARAARHALAAALLLATAGAVVIFAIGGRLLLIFGGAYASSSLGLLRLVTLAAIPGSVTYVYLAIERARRRAAQLVLASAAVAGTTIVASVVLMQRDGITGAGVGILLGQCAGVLSCCLSSVRRT